MTALRPWVGFDSLVDGLARLQARAREAAVRSVDEILTLRNWLIGAWIVAYEPEGADRACYGEGLIDALAAAFSARGVPGLSGRNLRNYRQIALTWPQLATGRTLLGEMGTSGSIWQTLSAESPPALTTGSPLSSNIRQTLSGDYVPDLATTCELLPWQDDAWMLRLRRELSFSHLLELSRVSEVHYATGTLDHQVFVSRYLTRLPTEQQLRAWLAKERELLVRRPSSKEGEP